MSRKFKLSAFPIFKFHLFVFVRFYSEFSMELVKKNPSQVPYVCKQNEVEKQHYIYYNDERPSVEGNPRLIFIYCLLY